MSAVSITKLFYAKILKIFFSNLCGSIISILSENILMVALIFSLNCRITSLVMDFIETEAFEKDTDYFSDFSDSSNEDVLTTSDNEFIDNSFLLFSSF